MQTQQKIQQLIQKYEQEIEQLLQTKRKQKATETLAINCEIAILNKQQFVAELRSLL